MKRTQFISIVLLALAVTLVAFAVPIGGPPPKLAKLIDMADAIVILRIDRHISGFGSPTFYSTHECFIYQTIKGDIPKNTRIKLQLMNTKGSFATPYSWGSTHLMFLMKKVAEDEPTEYRTVKVNGAQILLSPLGHEKSPQGRTIEQKIKNLIKDSIAYQAKENQKNLKFLETMLGKQGMAETQKQKDRLASTIDSSGFNSRYIYSLCLDNNAIPHVLYQGFSVDHPILHGPFVHAELREGRWQKETILERVVSSHLYGSIHADFDSEDSLHVLYCVGGTGYGLKYGSRSSGKWSHQTIFNENVSKSEMKKLFGLTSSSFHLLSPNICMSVGTDDILHMAFLDPAKHVLRYRTKQASDEQWKPHVVDDVGPHNITVSRIWPAITAGSNGGVLMTYKKYVEEDTNIRKRSIELMLAASSGNNWMHETVAERMGYIDGISQLVIDSKAVVHILYTRIKPSMIYGLIPDMDLVYATREGTEWKNESIFTMPDNGTFSLALSPDGNPCVLVNTSKHSFMKYSEGKAGDIILLKRNKGKWSTTTIADGDAYAAGAKMRIDKSGLAHIVFPSVDGSKNGALTLKYAVISGGLSKSK
jgi:hypothetical protein